MAQQPPHITDFVWQNAPFLRQYVDDEPWKRAYVIFKQGANSQFLPDAA
jgi:hypothetical protein